MGLNVHINITSQCISEFMHINGKDKYYENINNSNFLNFFQKTY